MIDIKQLREAPDRVRQALGRRRRADLDKRLDEILRDDENWRRLIQHTEKLKAESNKASAEVARLKRAKEDAGPAMTGLKDLSDSIKAGDTELRSIEARIQDQLLQIPNIPLPDVPDGDAAANKIVGEWGKPAKLAFAPKPHWELGEALGILDLERGAKISGSGFPVFIGLGAKLVRALVTFMLDIHTTEHGYTEVAPPLLVNRATAQGTGQLPDLENNMYVTEDGLYLVPTAEVPVTNLHRDEVLGADVLPRGYCAYTPCFRREAGAAGKDTRGILRVHQFDKVEIVRFCRPEESPAEHEKILRHAQIILERLELSYRTVALATGDMGFSSAKTYDLEAWAAGVGAWLEVSSASTFTDFQARRANIRYRPRPDAKPEFVHTLNASGVALPRTLIALLENNQQADGSVRIPKALVPYFGRDRLTPKPRNAFRQLRRAGPEIVLSLVVLLGALSVWQAFTIAGHLRNDARDASRIFGRIIAGFNDPDPAAETEMLVQIVVEIRETGLPMIITDSLGQPTAFANLPFGEVAFDDPRIVEFARKLDLKNPPISGPGGGQIHFGPVPVARHLTWLALLQIGLLATTIAMGLWAYRIASNRNRDRLWVAMARESAHQLGTPLMSARAWIDRLEKGDQATRDVARYLTADIERLERVAQRFERIGRPAHSERVGLGTLAERVATYFAPRLPQHANKIDLQVRAPDAGPVIKGDPVLLEWALESLVRNAVDALSGRGGAITIEVKGGAGTASITVTDDGPGVPLDIRSTLFEPGVSTKPGGWGIGLALAQRIVEEVHGGRLEFIPATKGATFRAQLPEDGA